MKLFVYGTLKRGFYFHSYLKDKAEYLGMAKTNKNFIIYIDGLPHMVRESGSGPVYGELYEANEDVIKALDELEGHPDYFKREMIPIFGETGEEIEAWAYIHAHTFRERSKEHRTDFYE